MDIALKLDPNQNVSVIVDRLHSHVFPIMPLLHGQPEALNQPQALGAALFHFLFPAASLARQALDQHPERIQLVCMDPVLQTVPWEFLYGPRGYLVCDYPFVRSVPTTNGNNSIPQLTELHVIAMPSNPVDRDLPPLNIESEWIKLCEDLSRLSNHLLLERVRPAALSALRKSTVGKTGRVIHFMGHGMRTSGSEAALCFEKQTGELDVVSARDFVRRIKDSAYLVTLNACNSAQSLQFESTEFSNLALALVREGIPYALGMQYKIGDSDALTFTRAFYADLARGSTVETALHQARLELANTSVIPWAVGVPALYTCLSEVSKTSFQARPGRPIILDPLPPHNLEDLGSTEGNFQGRASEMAELGKRLTLEPRARLVTIHGVGGQGKTRLARQAAERYLWAWPGGIWAVSLENLPTRERFVQRLADMLDNPITAPLSPADQESAVLQRLSQKRALIILDNAETLLDAVDNKNQEALSLAQFLKGQIPSTQTCLLVTSRRRLDGWAGEQALELGGLTVHAGAKLFMEWAPKKLVDIQQAEALSKEVDGHPLSLHLLGAAFNEQTGSLEEFSAEVTSQLLAAQDRYKGDLHPHYKLFAAIDTSTRSLNPAFKQLLGGLVIFKAPFEAEAAKLIFTPDAETSPIPAMLETLWMRGLLERRYPVPNNLRIFYALPPVVRLYAESELIPPEPLDRLLAKLGTVYENLLESLYYLLDQKSEASFIARLCEADLIQAMDYCKEEDRGWYHFFWGAILQRLGNQSQGVKHLEIALEIEQGSDSDCERLALNNLGGICDQMGQPKQALKYYEQALSIHRKLARRAAEAGTLNNIGSLYHKMGKIEEALDCYLQALAIFQEVRDRNGEGTTMNNIGGIHLSNGQPLKAIDYLQKALPIMKEVGNRMMVARILSNLGLLHQRLNQPQKAMEYFQQALPILKQVGDQAGGATVLNNIGAIHMAKGHLREALECFEKARDTLKDVGDQDMFAYTLNNISMVYNQENRFDEAVELLKQALQINQETGHVASQASTLHNLAVVLHQGLHSTSEAISYLQRAIDLLYENHLGWDDTGASVAEYEAVMAEFQRSQQGQLPEQAVEVILNNTIAVLTNMPENLQAWREIIRQSLEAAQKDHLIAEIAFFEEILNLLDGKPASLPAGHPYAQILSAMQAGDHIERTPDNSQSELTDELFQALSDFSKCENLSEVRQVVEKWQAVLLQPESIDLIEALIKEIQDERKKKILQSFVLLLKVALERGIPAAFELAQNALLEVEALEKAEKIGSDFITICVRGLRGTEEDRQDLTNFLAAMPIDKPDVDRFVRLMQLWLLGADPDSLEPDVSEEIRPLWDVIRKQVSDNSI